MILCYDKSKAPPHDFHPLRSRSCLRRRQVSSSQFLGARALDSSQLSSLREPSAQLVFRFLRPPKLREPIPSDCIPCRLPLPLGRRDGWGRSLTPSLQGRGSASRWHWWGLWSPAGHSPQSAPWAPPAHSLGLRLHELEAPGEKAGIHLFPHSPPDNRHSTDCWLNGTSNGCSLAVGRWWEEPTGSRADQWLRRTTNGRCLDGGGAHHGADQWLNGTCNCSNPPALVCMCYLASVPPDSLRPYGL